MKAVDIMTWPVVSIEPDASLSPAHQSQMVAQTHAVRSGATARAEK